MRLDRNINDNKRGKYALLKLRKLDEFTAIDDPFQEVAKPIADAISTLEKAGIIDWGVEGTESEFFVIKLRDVNAPAGLYAYGASANHTDSEYAGEVWALADRAGTNSQFCKKPD